MNKFEASISLCIITFFASVQYAFLAGVPSSVSQFAYLTLTNAAGFFIVLLFFFGELFRLDKKQIFQSFILSLEQVAFNVLLILGTGKTGATVTACVLSAYFVFIPPLALLLFREKPDFRTFPGIAIVLVGLFFMMNCEASALLDEGILYLVLADVVIALTILTMAHYSTTSNPSIIAMGQLFFSLLISAACWIVEILFFGKSFTLPTEPSFWICALYVSFFIRGLYGIVQLYAMRYVSALSTSLIFSTEIIMTMLISPVLAFLFGTEKEDITSLRAIGACIMVAGVLLADSAIYSVLLNGLKKLVHARPKKKNFSFVSILSLISGLKKWGNLIIIIMVLYAVLDLIVQKMNFLQYESVIGLKNFLPVSAGLLWGVWGAIGTSLGCILSALILKTSLTYVCAECFCNLFIGVGIWIIWHRFVKSHYVGFNHKRHFVLYILSLAFLSLLSAYIVSFFLGQKEIMHIFASYTSMGIFVSLPIIILFSSLLHVQTVIPSKYKLMPDVNCSITSDSQSFIACNEQIEETAALKKIAISRVFELQNCIEELTIRVLKALPDTNMNVTIVYGSAISIRIVYDGNPYNPFKLGENEDELDIAGLKLLRHRALRASVFTNKKRQETQIHIVM